MTSQQRLRNAPSLRVMTSQVPRGSHGLHSALKVIGGRIGSLAKWHVCILLACARFTSLYIYCTDNTNRLLRIFCHRVFLFFSIPHACTLQSLRTESNTEK